LSVVKDASVAADELSLAKQLIKGGTSRFDLSAYKDDYEALSKSWLMRSGKENRFPLPKPEPAKSRWST